jgi:hypothetical protein
MNQEIFELKRKIIDNMARYMRFGGAVDENDPEYDPEFDAGYTREHVHQCSACIDDYLSSLEKTPEVGKDEYILAVVEKTVLRLNKLNDECDGNLIETDQREDLCKLIDIAARQSGLESSADDITYEWRNW